MAKLFRAKLKASRTGIGLAALGRPGYINLNHAKDLEHDYDVLAMEARAHKVLDAAFARGVCYFDVARSYGKAEAFLGTWLEQNSHAAGDITVGSKWGYTYTANWQVQADKHEVKEHSLVNLEKQWRKSRALLGEHLDLYQIHSATLETGVLKNAAVLDKLAELKAGGTAVGLSLSGPGQMATLEQALSVKAGDGLLFDAVQATFNVLEPSAGKMLELAHAEGLGVIVKEAVANGRLTNRNNENKLEILKTQAERLGTTPDALALAFILDKPWVDVVLSGAASVEQLESNLQALDVTLDDEVRALFADLRETPEAYWQTRSELSWN